MKTSHSLICTAAFMVGIPCIALGQPAVTPPSASAAVTMLQRVCLPLIEGGNLGPIAKANHLRRKDGQWMLIIDRKRRLDLNPPDTVNPRVCGATITHSVGSGPAIRQAVDDWARSRSPALTAVKIDQTSAGPTYLRTTSTWRGADTHGVLGVVLSEEKTLKGAPVAGSEDQSEIEISITPNAT